MNEELNLTKYEGDDVSIQCKHHDEHQKCFCKAHEPSMCVKDGVSLETIRDDRFSFSDEASTGVFTVNITDLREEDSGIYWCGSHIITKVHLNINNDKNKSKSVYFISLSNMNTIFCICSVPFQGNSSCIEALQERPLHECVMKHVGISPIVKGNVI
ncbi:hypothetical protein PO909_016206, partial [Leuciscus waleckii]